MAVIGPLLDGALSDGDWRLLPTVANRMPTAASATSRRRATRSIARSSSTSCASSTARIAEITTFGPELFAQQFGLPATVEG